MDDVASESLLLQGDMTGSVLISGSPTMVSSYMNSNMGLRIFTSGRPVSNKLALFKAVDVSKPTFDESLCDQGLLSNHRLLQLLPLGLTQNISKAKVELDKRVRKNP